jgi:hypothetical protein
MTEKNEKKPVVLKADGHANPSDAKSADYEPAEAPKNSVLGSRELKRGDRGEDVTALQRKLGVEPSGHFNEETEAKVNYLRRILSLEAGSVDAEFLARIK